MLQAAHTAVMLRARAGWCSSSLLRWADHESGQGQRAGAEVLEPFMASHGLVLASIIADWSCSRLQWDPCGARLHFWMLQVLGGVHGLVLSTPGDSTAIWSSIPIIRQCCVPGVGISLLCSEATACSSVGGRGFQAHRSHANQRGNQ